MWHQLNMSQRYTATTVLYGALHSVWNLWDRKGSYYNSKTNRREMQQLLAVDKVGYAGVITCTAPIYWPILLYYDLKRTETTLRCKDAADFNDWHMFL